MAIGEATSLADRKRRAGQRLLVGFEGLAATDELRRLIDLVQPAGFLLFGHNIAEIDQVLDLGAELRSRCDPHRPPILAVDQEGGRVQRLRSLDVEWPPMEGLFRSPHLLEGLSRRMARQLRALGLHLNLAPVAELGAAGSPIGDRAFGSRPRDVADAVERFVRAHQDEGVMACAKHFPGHGGSAIDSHDGLPVREGPVDWRDDALRPFEAAVRAGVAVIMTAHVLIPDVDPLQPVPFSARVVPPWLRRDLGHEGVVCSDDLVMAAVRDRLSIDEQAHRLTAATVDLLVVGKEPERQVAIFEALVRAQERDRGFEAATVRSAGRIHTLRERFWLPHRAPVDRAELADPFDQALAERIVRETRT